MILEMELGSDFIVDWMILKIIIVKNALAAVTSLSKATYTMNVKATIMGGEIQKISVEMILSILTFFIILSSTYLLVLILS
jgi:hypothetical protein